VVGIRLLERLPFLAALPLAFARGGRLGGLLLLVGRDPGQPLLHVALALEVGLLLALLDDRRMDPGAAVVLDPAHAQVGNLGRRSPAVVEAHEPLLEHARLLLLAVLGEGRVALEPLAVVEPMAERLPRLLVVGVDRDDLLQRLLGEVAQLALLAPLVDRPQLGHVVAGLGDLLLVLGVGVLLERGGGRRCGRGLRRGGGDQGERCKGERDHEGIGSLGRPEGRIRARQPNSAEARGEGEDSAALGRPARSPPREAERRQQAV
jgi:hypothetical protein